MEKMENLRRSAVIGGALILALICMPLSSSFGDSNRQDKMRDINQVFQSAVDKANLDASNGLVTATTQLQKSKIKSTRRNAIDAAIDARDASIAALGPKPVAPTQSAQPSSSPKTTSGNDAKVSESPKPVAPTQSAQPSSSPKTTSGNDAKVSESPKPVAPTQSAQPSSSPKTTKR
jgi:hypothetical protein